MVGGTSTTVPNQSAQRPRMQTVHDSRRRSQVLIALPVSEWQRNVAAKVKILV